MFTSSCTRMKGTEHNFLPGLPSRASCSWYAPFITSLPSLPSFIRHFRYRHTRRLNPASCPYYQTNTMSVFAFRMGAQKSLLHGSTIQGVLVALFGPLRMHPPAWGSSLSTFSLAPDWKLSSPPSLTTFSQLLGAVSAMKSPSQVGRELTARLFRQQSARNLCFIPSDRISSERTRSVPNVLTWWRARSGDLRRWRQRRN